MVYRIEVSDNKKQHPPKTYDVETSAVFVAYGIATKKYVIDCGIAPYKVGTSSSRYYSRFSCKSV
jgi:hypothetical protein